MLSHNHFWEGYFINTTWTLPMIYRPYHSVNQLCPITWHNLKFRTGLLPFGLGFGSQEGKGLSTRRSKKYRFSKALHFNILFFSYVATVGIRIFPSQSKFFFPFQNIHLSSPHVLKIRTSQIKLIKIYFATSLGSLSINIAASLIH